MESKLESRVKLLQIRQLYPQSEKQNENLQDRPP